MPRWTFKELGEISNKQYILRILEERRKGLDSISPISRKCTEVMKWVEKRIPDGNEQAKSELFLPYYGYNEKIRAQISYVLLNVPESVRKFAYQRCIFTSISEKYAGTCAKLPIQLAAFEQPFTLWLIELAEDSIPYPKSVRYKKYSETVLNYYIAHELSHAFLGHAGKVDHSQVEIDADNLASKWGFGMPNNNRGND